MHLLIPSTYGIDQRDEKLKIAAYGRLARAAAIFGVDQVTIYRDDDPKADEARNAELMEKYLSYAECPPYLRKQLIPRDPDLQYANILPPLQILSHGYSDEFREAVVTAVGEQDAVLDAGLDEEVTIPADPALSVDDRLTLRHTADGDWEPVDPAQIAGYWTTSIEHRRDDLGTVLADVEAPVIGTSRHGDDLATVRGSAIADRRDVAVVFGSAWRGLPDLIDRGDCTEDQFDAMVDFVPGQHTKTVRTGEAVYIVLGILNTLRA